MIEGLFYQETERWQRLRLYSAFIQWAVVGTTVEKVARSLAKRDDEQPLKVEEKHRIRAKRALQLIQEAL